MGENNSQHSLFTIGDLRKCRRLDSSHLVTVVLRSFRHPYFVRSVMRAHKGWESSLEHPTPYNVDKRKPSKTFVILYTARVTHRTASKLKAHVRFHIFVCFFIFPKFLLNKRSCCQYILKAWNAMKETCACKSKSVSSAQGSQRGEGAGAFGRLEPRIFYRGTQSPKPFSTWSPNKNADSDSMKPWNAAMEAIFFSVLEP